MGAFDTKKRTGAFVSQEPATQSQAHTIEISGREGKTDQMVITRTLVTQEDEAWVTNALIKTIAKSRTRLTPADQLQLADRLWLQRLIVSWNLPIPLEPDRAKAIAALSQADRDYLYQAIMAAQKQGEQKRRELGMRGPSPALRNALKEREKRFNQHLSENSLL